ncbi:MAG TPA: hypothetical protein VMT85_06120 [Thermoanaerobaculia bacterium]|nr:hypothetical protein [Thermoanaerobaculia bacterium]
MRKTLLSILAILVAICLPTSAALAGTVYVALASNMVLDGIEYRTVLEVSNPALVERSFSTHFIEAFQDGTTRPDEVQTPFTVPPGRTLLFTGLSSEDQRGMLEISADRELVFSARLVPVTDDGSSGIGGRVPVISSDNLIQGGERFFVQGILRDDARATTFGLVNLAQIVNECSVDLVGADGSRRIDTAVLSLPPLSANQFDDVLQIVGIPQAAQIRAEVECSSPAYAYAFVLDSSDGVVSGIDVSQTGASLLSAPGQQLPCPEGAECFEWPGLLHRPTPGNETRTVMAELTPGSVYRTLKLRLTIDLVAWNRDTGAIHNFFWLYRNGWVGNTFGYTNVRGPGKDKVSNLTNVDLPRGLVKNVRIDQALQAGETYVADYTYDTRSGRIELLILDTSGGLVARLTDSVSTNVIRQEGEGFFVQVGLEGHFNEVPSYGWNYRDLRLDFLP